MKLNRWLWRATRVTMGALLVCSLAAPASANGGRGGWQPSQMLLRTDGTQVPGGCPIETPAGLFVFTARNPSGSNIDIYVNQRSHPTAALAPGNVLSTIISHPDANDFCPTPLRDGELYFVSNRMNSSKCGGGADPDIYRSVNNPATGYSEPEHLGCEPRGPNTPGTEFSPSVLTNEWGTFLFYSTDYHSGNQDIYVSYQRRNGTFGPGIRLGYPITTMYDDKQPNVSQDGREIVFASNRPDMEGGDQKDQFDIFYARRHLIFLPWRKVKNLSQSVPFEPADADESRPSLSWDGKRLIYGSGGVWESERRGRRGRY